MVSLLKKACDTGLLFLYLHSNSCISFYIRVTKNPPPVRQEGDFITLYLFCFRIFRCAVRRIDWNTCFVVSNGAYFVIILGSSLLGALVNVFHCGAFCNSSYQFISGTFLSGTVYLISGSSCYFLPADSDLALCCFRFWTGWLRDLCCGNHSTCRFACTACVCCVSRIFVLIGLAILVSNYIIVIFYSCFRSFVLCACCTIIGVLDLAICNSRFLQFTNIFISADCCGISNIIRNNCTGTVIIAVRIAVFVISVPGRGSSVYTIVISTCYRIPCYRNASICFVCNRFYIARSCYNRDN